MSMIGEKDVQTEIVNFARSLVKDPVTANYTTASQSFTAIEGQTEFTLTYYASCVNSVTVASVSKHWGSDYTFTIASKKIILITGASAGQTVTVSYDYIGVGTTLATINGAWGEWGFPSIGLQPDDYPVFGLLWLSNSHGVTGIGYDGLLGERVMRLWVYSASNDQVRSLLKEFAQDFMSKNDWYIDGKIIGKSIVPIVGPTEPSLDARRKGRYFGGFVDFMLPNIYESRS